MTSEIKKRGQMVRILDFILSILDLGAALADCPLPIADCEELDASTPAFENVSQST